MTAQTFTAVVRPASTFSTFKNKGGNYLLGAAAETALAALTATSTVNDVLDILSTVTKTQHVVAANQIGLASSSVGTATSTADTTTPPAAPAPVAVALALALTSSDFTTGNALPVNVGLNFTGPEPTSPQLGWALTGDDAANVTEYRLSSVDTSNANYVHWDVTGIVNTTLEIAASTDTTTSNWPGTPTLGATGGGFNANMANGWEPAGPPIGDTHTYTFTVTGHSADGTLLVTSNVLSGTYTG